MQTLGVAFGLVGNYLPADFHRQVVAHAERTTKKANTPLKECVRTDEIKNWKFWLHFF